MSDVYYHLSKDDAVLLFDPARNFQKLISVPLLFDLILYLFCFDYNCVALRNQLSVYIQRDNF